MRFHRKSKTARMAQITKEMMTLSESRRKTGQKWTQTFHWNFLTVVGHEHESGWVCRYLILLMQFSDKISPLKDEKGNYKTARSVASTHNFWIWCDSLVIHASFWPQTLCHFPDNESLWQFVNKSMWFSMCFGAILLDFRACAVTTACQSWRWKVV